MADHQSIYEPSTGGTIRQGEIISQLTQVRLKIKRFNTKSFKGENFIHPLCIVVTQDCDLEQDYKARFDNGPRRRHLPNILFCEVATAQEMLYGDTNRNVFNSGTVRNNFKNNDDIRFHFLQRVEEEEDALGQGLDEMGVEFRRYFTIPTQEVYHRLENGNAQKRCRLRSPYLEHFSTRFHYYHYRVALPNDHESV